VSSGETGGRRQARRAGTGAAARRLLGAAAVIGAAGCSGSSNGGGEDGGTDGPGTGEQSDALDEGSTDGPASDGQPDGPAYPGRCATPTFSPPSGTYQAQTGFTVIINDATFDAKIYYTTDDTEPTPTSHVYSAPIALSQSTTIKAYCTAATLIDSSIATADYVLR